MINPVYLKDLRVGSVVKDNSPARKRTYKILSKTAGSIYCEVRDRVLTRDDTVMPPVDTWEERTTKLGIAPTARLSEFRGGTDDAGGGA